MTYSIYKRYSGLDLHTVVVRSGDALRILTHTHTRQSKKVSLCIICTFIPFNNPNFITILFVYCLFVRLFVHSLREKKKREIFMFNSQSFQSACLDL